VGRSAAPLSEQSLSLTDPDARHGHKTDRQTFAGFKLHLLGDLVSGLITAVTVTRGNVHDGKVAHRLVRRAKILHEHISQVLGDTAYGGATLRHRLQAELEVKLVAPLPPHSGSQTLGRAAIVVDFAAPPGTCAAGVPPAAHRRVWSKDDGCHVSAFRWPVEICRTCKLASRCNGDRRGGHRVRLHAHERELRQARDDWEQPEVRELYRTRSQCERLVHRAVRHGARRARSHRLGAAHLQAHAIVIVANPKLLARAMLPNASATSLLDETARSASRQVPGTMPSFFVGEHGLSRLPVGTTRQRG
jgi:hypothetical protein